MYRIGIFVLIFSAILVASWTTSPIIEPKTEVTLGEKLFFDPILSLDSTISCATCHKPEFAFADTVAISPGVGNVVGIRNAPSVMNMAFRDLMFYDGRAKNLVHQVHFPIEDPAEMNLAMDSLVNRLKKHEKYPLWFKNIYSEEIDKENIAKAIAAFERSLETDDSPFDRYMNGDAEAISESAKRGRTLFLSEKAKCFDCHFGPDFTGDEFKNIGLFDGEKYTDKGRFAITKDSADLGKFKVPGLRNVAVTGPYMHDGSLKTLKEVIDYYDDPFKHVINPINSDSLMMSPIRFSKQEKIDLEAFLLTLTDYRFVAR